MAAPALAASRADWAICSGVTGTAGLRPGVSAEPVTAHEIMTLRCMPASLAADVLLRGSLPRGRGQSPEVPLRRRTQSRRAIVFFADVTSARRSRRDDVQMTRNRAMREVSTKL